MCSLPRLAESDVDDPHATASAGAGARASGSNVTLRSSTVPTIAIGVGAALLLLLVAVTGFGLAVLARPTVPAWASTTPAIANDFADPAVLVANGAYYAYATNAGGKNIQVARSTDLRQWTMLPDALPTLPAWASANGAWVWAPDVIAAGGRFVMYYTARDAGSGRQCVGVATSAAPAGPFRDANAHPLVCQLELGGTIDPSALRDGNALYLYFKSDGNCCHMPTQLWGQRLAADGLTLLGKPVALLTNDQPWEGAVVEAPSMLQHAGGYDLFYSGNDFASARYAVGYARCQSPLGPCTKTTESPILASGPHAAGTPLAGPGGASFFQAHGSTWIAYHAWHVTPAGGLSQSRYLLISRLVWRGAEPVVLPWSDEAP